MQSSRSWGAAGVTLSDPFMRLMFTAGGWRTDWPGGRLVWRLLQRRDWAEWQRFSLTERVPRVWSAENHRPTRLHHSPSSGNTSLPHPSAEKWASHQRLFLLSPQCPFCRQSHRVTVLGTLAVRAKEEDTPLRLPAHSQPSFLILCHPHKSAISEGHFQALSFDPKPAAFNCPPATDKAARPDGSAPRGPPPHRAGG